MVGATVAVSNLAAALGRGDDSDEEKSNNEDDCNEPEDEDEVESTIVLLYGGPY